MKKEQANKEELLNKKIRREKLQIFIISLIIIIILGHFMYISTRATLRKPILYLYPEQDTIVNVRLEHSDNIISSYPKYIDGWNVSVTPDGNINYQNRNYYALYWDENLYHKVTFEEGFYVEKNNAISFLEEKLDLIGLNEREANEFIMYWLPVLENNEKSIVYFELTEEREKNNKLIITPEPDSLLRIAIHIKKVSKKTDIKEQQLVPFERTGFTAVEWGGVNY